MLRVAVLSVLTLLSPPSEFPSFACLEVSLPLCSEMCLTPRVCADVTGYDEETCKACLTRKPAEQCVFAGRELGYCTP